MPSLLTHQALTGPIVGIIVSFSPWLHAQDRDSIGAILDQRVEHFAVRNQEARIVLEGIGEGYRFPVLIEPGVQGTVSFEVHNATVRTLLEAICQPRGWSYDASDRGYLLVRRFVTRIYPVDYLQMTQMGTSSASISLSESAGGVAVGALGTMPNGVQPSMNLAGSAVNTLAPNQLNAAGAMSGGNSALSVSQQNDTDFWGRLESDLKAMVGEGETLIVNRFAGLIQIRGSLRTHAVIGAYLRRVLQRVGRQARISVKIIEVDLNDQAKSGIDWSIVGASLGRIANTSLNIASASTATGAIAQAGSITLGPNTFSGTIGVGGIQAVIAALADQGTVRVESKPEIAALNNQTAFVQVSEDQPFFSRINSTTINAGGSALVGNQPIVNTNYSESTVSFGNFLEITVQIADDLSTKLSLSPAMTELKGTVTSPDGQETAPITDTKRARTTVTLRNHETAVVGGFITETTAKDRRSVPILSKVPIVGEAFATAAKARTRTELVFLVTVNAEEPPTVSPIETDCLESGSLSSSVGPQGARTEKIQRVQRIDISGA